MGCTGKFIMITNTGRSVNRTKKLSGMCKVIKKLIDGEELTAVGIQKMLRLKSRCEAQNYIDIIGYHFPVYERKAKKKTGKRGRNSTIFKMLEPENRPNG